MQDEAPRLMIVDDEEEIRILIERHFRFLGYQVKTAADGIEALETLDQWRTDVLITDILMPRMDGIELALQVRDRYPMVKVVMITGQVTLTNLLAGLRHGAHAVIFKPLLSMEELEHAVLESVEILRRWRAKLKQLSSLGNP